MAYVTSRRPYSQLNFGVFLEIMPSAWEKYPEAQVWSRSQGPKRSGAQKKEKETMR
jgi:hypothetical protein